MAPGMLYVTMEPGPDLPPDVFHEWYNNEHGPTRLRLPHIFANGLRYRATDGAQPEFLAVYDVTDMNLLATPTYTRLRENRSPREAETIARVDVGRRFLDLAFARQSPSFRPLEELTDAEAEGVVLVAVEITLADPAGEAEFSRWFDEEHAPMLSRIPGWLRSRRFKTSASEGMPATHVALNEYAGANGLGGPEHREAMSTPWRDEVFRNVAEKARRTYELFYVFGPAPRDLVSLSRLPAPGSFSDATTSTTADASAVIASRVAAADGLQIQYRLEGNPSPDAPTVAFCNSLLTSLHMWDALVAILRSRRPEFRILRYDARGRHSIPSPPVPATLGTLSDDLAALLNALRIPALHALVGVSMGGATTVRFALDRPTRLRRFVACDFNVAGSEANTKAWKERIAVAESGPDGIAKLARLTVERWFHPHTLAHKEDAARSMTDMVAANDVEGFRHSCQALWDYDMRDALKGCAVPGLLVVGEGDGKGALVKAMDGFKAVVGGGAELKIVPLAGHLPMFESPAEFWEAVDAFL